MKIPKRPTQTKEYEKDGVTYTLKPLSVADYDTVTDLITAEKKGTALRFAANAGVIAWSGIDEQFSKASLNELEPSLVYELGGEVMQISSVTETEKNS